MQETVVSEPVEQVKEPPVARAVQIWLLLGVVLVFMQVVIGGITRLTDSGLSITEWAVIQGTLPPLNEVEWIEAFDKYKVAAKKQFETLHVDMTMGEFKFIFFWEYFHRLWARMMGLVFAVPFFIFWWRGMLPKWLMRRLGIVILLAAAAASFGWIMVASGLNDDTRTWVSAYKLIIHLGIATSLFGYLFWTWLRVRQPISFDGHFQLLRRSAWILTVLLLVQILFGGLMAGMRAALIHPHFPYFVSGESFFQALFVESPLAADQLVNYEPAQSIKAWVQVFHRATAYLLVILIAQFFIRIQRLSVSSSLRTGSYILLGVLLIQFLLGVLTIIGSVGKVPIILGTAHQGVALLLLISLLYINYQLRPHRS